jgi:hypothetical protein
MAPHLVVIFFRFWRFLELRRFDGFDLYGCTRMRVDASTSMRVDAMLVMRTPYGR